MPKIALIQLKANPDKQDNISKTHRAIEQAAANGAQIICTQELFTTEYFCRVQDPAQFDLADSIPSELTAQQQALAKSLGVVIIASGFEKRATGLYHNSAWIIDADGSLLGTYRKHHIPQDPGFEEKFYFTPGDTGYQCWDTQFGKLGVLNCWDQWYPEAARITALKGAEILFYPTAIGWLPDEKEALGEAQHCAWETIQRGHGVANSCYVAAVNRVGTEGDIEFWGQSFVSDHCGQIIAKATADKETILYAELDLKQLEQHRRMWPFLRDRRIDSYQDISKRFID